MATHLPATTLEAQGAERPASAEHAEPRWQLSPTTAYIARRLGLYLITLWGAVTASFVFFRLVPGDPIRAVIAQLETQGQYQPQEQTQAIIDHYKQTFGLDGNLFEQYVRYLDRVILHWDFGPSVLSYPSPSIDLITRALPWTLGLIGTATVLGWLVGVVAGTFTGWARTTRAGNWITNFSLVFSHIPAYFIALFGVFILAYRYPVFPANGAYDGRLTPTWSFEFALSVIKHGTLPVMATAAVAAASWLIGTRALVVSILGEDYLTYANAKGLAPSRILNRYVMRNAWLPQVAALGIAMGGVVNGNVLVERLFRYPGLGNLLIDSITVKDVNTAMAIVTIFIIGVLTLNLIIDLMLPLIDPRVKYES